MTNAPPSRANAIANEAERPNMGISLLGGNEKMVKMSFTIGVVENEP